MSPVLRFSAFLGWAASMRRRWRLWTWAALWSSGFELTPTYALIAALNAVRKQHLNDEHH